MAYLTKAELQNAQNNRDHQLFMDAHRRRMERRGAFIESNPGAVSPQERAAVQSWQHRQGLTGRESALQAHELKMLETQNAGNLAVQQEKTKGMIGQGSEATRITADANLEIARLNDEGQTKRTQLGLESQERQHGASLLTQQEIAMAGNEVETQKNQSQFGYFDAQGNYVPGSQVAAERARGESAESVARIQGQSAVKVAKETGAAQVAATKEAAAQRAEQAEAKIRQGLVDKIMTGKIRGMSPQQWKAMSAEEQQAYLDELVQK